MLDFSNESIKTSPSSVLSSLTFGLWVSSHLSNQSAKVVRRNARSDPPPTWCGVLDHPQGSVSSTSCLHLQGFPSLQFFASISGFNFLHRFWLSWKSFFPLLYPPHGLRIPPCKSFLTFFFCFFCVFLPSIFVAVFWACFFINFWCF